MWLHKELLSYLKIKRETSSEIKEEQVPKEAYQGRARIGKAKAGRIGKAKAKMRYN